MAKENVTINKPSKPFFMATNLKLENIYVVSTPNWVDLDYISDTELTEDKLREIHEHVQIYLQEYLKKEGFPDSNCYSLDIKIYVNDTFSRLFHLVVNLVQFPFKELEGFITADPGNSHAGSGVSNVPPKPNPPGPLSFKGFQPVSAQFNLISHVTTLSSNLVKASEIRKTINNLANIKLQAK
jgi:hypothetical protein